jgi:threonine/homoserine/homoserine lactone efflux protein
MVPLSHVLAFALAAAVLIAIPGPNVLFVVGRTLARGRIAGLLSVVGTSAGMLLQTIAVAIGVGAIVAQSIAALTVIKIAGALYLVFLGIQAIRHRTAVADPAATRLPRSAARIFVEGFLVGVTNPKSIVFFVAVLPQFIDPSAGPAALQLAELGGIFVLLALAMDSGWVLTAGFAGVGSLVRRSVCRSSASSAG